jgi:mono/diheme cytochrome c family protein
MSKVLRWTVIVLGGSAGLILLAAVALYARTRLEFSRTYDMQVEPIAIRRGVDSVEHGKHLAAILCAECHGSDLGGTPNWLVLPGIAVISPPNLTAGQGSVTAGFTDEDWIRVLRHGVKRDGRSVFVMRSVDFYFLSDRDLGDLLAYVQSVPPVDRQHATLESAQLTFLGGVLYGAGAFGNQLGASRIQQDSRPSSFPEPGVAAAYGEYLVNINGCRACHGAELAGGKPPDPQSVLAPNLTPGGELSAWTGADFIRAMRTGTALSGHELDPRFMPWQYKGQMTDTELKAIFLYLQSLPKLPGSTAPAE